MGQYPLPDRDALLSLVTYPVAADWRLSVQRVFLAQGYSGGPWYYKGAKMCIMWPMWVRAFPDAKWIIVRRKASEIVDSCLRTGFMRNRDSRAGWGEWIDEHECSFNEMRNAGADIKEVWSNNIIAGDFSQLIEALDHCDVAWQQSAADFIDTQLFHTEGERQVAR